MNGKQKTALIRILLASLAVIIFSILPIDKRLENALMLIPYFAVGYDILRRAFKGIKNLQPFDENLLMAAATLGAIALGDFREAAAVMLFYRTGELFESVAVGKSRRSISALMDIRPDSANLKTESGEIAAVDPDEVPAGSVIVVRPGERIPIDGVVVSGEAALNTSALTGESLPRDVGVGDRVISGSISMNGLLEIRTDREFGQSTVSRILELVENAGSVKSKSENFISRFARVYTPAVCLSAAALALLPPLVNLLAGQGADFSLWLYRALTFLVISCPCALVISIPLTFFAGLGAAGSKGVLIKGSAFIETLSKVGCVVFDKTGTVTKGCFEVSSVTPAGISEEKLMEYASLAEAFSTHPISRSIVRHYAGNIDTARVSELRELSGRGVSARIDGIRVCAGNGALMEALGIPYEKCAGAGTAVYLALDGRYAGSILVTDTLKEGAAEAVKALRRCGIRKTLMLTGDSKAAAEQTARALGVDEFHAELMPADKVALVEELLSTASEGEKLAFVGDGINDAPVLSRADIGISMGAMGSDAAIEAADIVLMDDDPGKIPLAIAVSRKCMRIVYENICFAIGVKLLCLILGALGIANMWWAVFADVGVMVIAVLNAVRALRV